MYSTRTLLCSQPEYPAALRQLARPPEVLFAKGNLAAFAQPCVAIIGSRRMSSYGEVVCEKLLRELAETPISIVSGLAYGVDGYAHRLAVKQKMRCVAVLGSGIERVYPWAHRQLAKDILQTDGCLLSEYSGDSPPLPHQFPQRNRIIAGLSVAVVIIEAAEKSGTLHTARFALEVGREVCVVPADITRQQSSGTHQLLKEGARPITCAEDILAVIKVQPTTMVGERLQPALTGSPAALYDSISRGACTVEALVEDSGLPVHELQSILTVLELDGYIRYKEQQWQAIS